jgi:hypothetical protein
MNRQLQRKRIEEERKTVYGSYEAALAPKPEQTKKPEGRFTKLLNRFRRNK